MNTYQRGTNRSYFQVGVRVVSPGGGGCGVAAGVEGGGPPAHRYTLSMPSNSIYVSIEQSGDLLYIVSCHWNRLRQKANYLGVSPKTNLPQTSMATRIALYY